MTDNGKATSPGTPNEALPPAGSPLRFERRWHLVGAGLSNVWRFGDLELTAPTGRLLLRGPNGTGKTTALEALWPYLLDVNAARLAAGKARPTTLSSLMKEGATGRRRVGYAWTTIRAPDRTLSTLGVRLQFSEGASPAVRVIPFRAPGRPLHELPLYGVARATFSLDEFEERLAAMGGEVFKDADAYVLHWATNVFGSPARETVDFLASRLREVRNPSLLGDVSPQAAAEAVRASLPGISDDVLAATAEALAESDATREAFQRDREAAEALEEFRSAWSAHATEVVKSGHAAAEAAAKDLKTRERERAEHVAKLDAAAAKAKRAREEVQMFESSVAQARAEVKAIEERQAYKDAGRLKDLKATQLAQEHTAEATTKAMREAATAAMQETESLRGALAAIIEDLAEAFAQARSAEPETIAAHNPVSFSEKPRAAMRAGDVTVNPGPELVVQGDSNLLRASAEQWRNRAQAHEHRSNTALVALSLHKPVLAARTQAERAKTAAQEASTKAALESAKAQEADAAFRAEATNLIGLVTEWAADCSWFSSAEDAPSNETEAASELGWAVEALAGNEPSQVLAGCEALAHKSTVVSERLAAGSRQRAQTADTEATALRADAGAMVSEAAVLRSGRPLPLPRPEWVGPGDDSLALGTALEWHDAFGDPREQALVEAVLGASGLLGASLEGGAATTGSWRVDALGPTLDEHLGDIVRPDPEHAQRDLIVAILRRIRLVASAADQALPDAAHGLLIGRDGSFRAGVLVGRVPGADDPARLPEAQHVGAQRRRAAALARAAELERQAAELERTAQAREALAASLRVEANRVVEQARLFPSRKRLRIAESDNVTAHRVAQEATRHAESARAEAERQSAEAAAAAASWLERIREMGLPGEVGEIELLRERSAGAATKLRGAADRVGSRLAERLSQALARQAKSDIGEKLVDTERRAQVAVQLALDTATKHQVLEGTQGSAITEILERHADAEARATAGDSKLSAARTSLVDAEKSETAARSKVEVVEEQLEEARPRASSSILTLRTTLSVPGVADAVLDGDPLEDEGRLLEQVAAKLGGRKTVAKKTVRERADAARAKLAGTWSIDPGEDYGELLTYVLVHGEATYSPTQAAQRADMLRQRAQEALAASEERALREFVIGRLPGALGVAWTKLQDWVTEVNQKMRSAAASSGVTVQVRSPLKDDLPPATRTVHELSCKTSGAERTPEQQRRLGEALQALLEAADGETMLERVTSAVNIRDWVEVHYEVTRPGGKTQRWGSKTGLSGGERRLVVLAPMLAAVAAAYDRLGDRVLRLVALDEVPVEVDERGREGLARYIAELDLDLICTSYLWDGCPGAWDGIDAHDLEAGPDGTVVAFPMLVRTATAIPDDAAVVSAAAESEEMSLEVVG